MAADRFSATVDQYRELAKSCATVDCAKAHADRYQAQYDEHIAYLEKVVLPVVRMFREREEELARIDTEHR